ncbi:MAG: BON domain-containing protein [Rhodocyclaceae bacterium]
MKKALIHGAVAALACVSLGAQAYDSGVGVTHGYTVIAAGDTTTRQKMENAKDSTVQYVDDATVTTKVKAALAKDKTTKAHEIKVETNGGIVNLSGEVTSQAEISRASEVARNISGVQSVQNDLRLKTN